MPNYGIAMVVMVDVIDVVWVKTGTWISGNQWNQLKTIDSTDQNIGTGSSGLVGTGIQGAGSDTWLQWEATAEIPGQRVFSGIAGDFLWI